MLTIDYARTLYPADADSAHDFDHVLRVVKLAEYIAQREGADADIVRAAALLHDIGLAEGRAGHEASSARRARDILREHGYDEAAIDAVAHAIESHRFRSGLAPRTLEAKVLFDADKLDSIGAIGIARVFAFGGQRGQKLWADVSPEEADVEADSNRHTPVHEYHVKLKQIKDRLLTATGRAIAADRHAYMAGFYEQLDREVKGNNDVGNRQSAY
jgi:uncharacterized protein